MRRAWRRRVKGSVGRAKRTVGFAEPLPSLGTSVTGTPGKSAAATDPEERHAEEVHTDSCHACRHCGRRPGGVRAAAVGQADGGAGGQQPGGAGANAGDPPHRAHRPPRRRRRERRRLGSGWTGRPRRPRENRSQRLPSRLRQHRSGRRGHAYQRLRIRFLRSRFRRRRCGNADQRFAQRLVKRLRQLRKCPGDAHERRPLEQRFERLRRFRKRAHHAHEHGCIERRVRRIRISPHDAQQRRRRWSRRRR